MPHKDPVKRKEYVTSYWELHKEQKKENSRNYKKRRREWIDKIKSETCCIKCGEKRLPCLEFHHRDPSTKDKCVATLFSLAVPKDRILEEIAKCDVLCKNCHAMEHAKVEP